MGLSVWFDTKRGNVVLQSSQYNLHVRRKVFDLNVQVYVHESADFRDVPSTHYKSHWRELSSNLSCICRQTLWLKPLPAPPCLVKQPNSRLILEGME
jgi:hypothetical protein